METTLALLIDHTFERIGMAYHPGALEWLRENRPADWEKLVSLEKEINRLTSEEDGEGLTKALNKYERFVLKVVDVFSNYPVLEMWTEEDGKKTVLFSERILPVCSHKENAGIDESQMRQEKTERNKTKENEEGKQESFAWLHSRNDKDEEKI
jgi:hypothetical protein